MTRAVLLLLLFSSPAAAVECAPIAGGSPRLEHIDAGVRLTFLRERLRFAARRTRIWTWTWAGIYSTLTLVNGVLLANNPSQEDIVDRGIATGSAAIGVLSIGALPQKVMGDQLWLERRIHQAPPGTDVCALLADAERVLIRGAKSAAFGKSALVHAGNVLFNIGLGVLLGAYFNLWDKAAIHSLIGIAVGEISIYTQPDDTVHDLRRYRAGNLVSPRPPRWPMRLGVVPILGENKAGLAIGGSF